RRIDDPLDSDRGGYFGSAAGDFLYAARLVSVAPQTGAVLWRQPFRYVTSTAMTPVVAGDIVYCSAGYGVGSGAYKINRSENSFGVKELWFQPANVFNNHWS